MTENALIQEWYTRAGTKGDGSPAFNAVVLAHAAPCTLVVPSAERREDARRAGVLLSRVILLRRAAAVAQGLAPAEGVRVRVAMQRTPAVREELDVIEAREIDAAGDVAYELRMGRRLDGALGGA